MEQLLENIIKRHRLYITTELLQTFKRSDNTGKRTIDLTFIRGLKNVKVNAKDFNLIKTGHLATKFL